MIGEFVGSNEEEFPMGAFYVEFEPKTDLDSDILDNKYNIS